MKPFSNIRRASSLGGLALPFLFLFVVPVVSGQQSKPARVIESILGVGIGTSLEEAHAKLDRLSKRRQKESEKEETEEREAGRKEAWYLRTTDYATIALKADREGRVVWITGWLRPGREIPFAKLGDLSTAAGASDSRAVWNVATANGGYRLVAKGQNGKARVIYLLSLATPYAK